MVTYASDFKSALTRALAVCAQELVRDQNLYRIVQRLIQEANELKGTSGYLSAWGTVASKLKIPDEYRTERYIIRNVIKIMTMRRYLLVQYELARIAHAPLFEEGLKVLVRVGSEWEVATVCKIHIDGRFSVVFGNGRKRVIDAQKLENITTFVQYTIEWKPFN